METRSFSFFHGETKCQAIGDFFTKDDIPFLTEYYFQWKKINELNNLYNVRRINVPELLTEGMCSIILESTRTNNNNISGLISSSCDLVNYKTGETIQVKACSTTKRKKAGSASFGPRSEFDKLIFIHLDCDKDEMLFYDLTDEDYQTWKVNKAQTIKDQCEEKRRPPHLYFTYY